MRKRKQVHNGRPVRYDEKGRMFVESGRARVYLNAETMRMIEARKRKE